MMEGISTVKIIWFHTNSTKLQCMCTWKLHYISTCRYTHGCDILGHTTHYRVSWLWASSWKTLKIIRNYFEQIHISQVLHQIVSIGHISWPQYRFTSTSKQSTCCLWSSLPGKNLLTYYPKFCQTFYQLLTHYIHCFYTLSVWCEEINNTRHLTSRKLFWHQLIFWLILTQVCLSCWYVMPRTVELGLFWPTTGQIGPDILLLLLPDLCLKRKEERLSLGMHHSIGGSHNHGHIHIDYVGPFLGNILYSNWLSRLMLFVPVHHQQ